MVAMGLVARRLGKVDRRTNRRKREGKEAYTDSYCGGRRARLADVNKMCGSGHVEARRLMPYHPRGRDERPHVLGNTPSRLA